MQLPYDLQMGASDSYCWDNNKLLGESCEDYKDLLIER